MENRKKLKISSLVPLLLLAACTTPKPTKPVQPAIESIVPIKTRVACQERSVSKASNSSFFTETATSGQQYIGHCDKHVAQTPEIFVIQTGTKPESLSMILDYVLHPSSYYTSNELNEIDCVPNSQCAIDKTNQAEHEASIQAADAAKMQTIRNGISLHFESGKDAPLDTEALRGLPEYINAKNIQVVIVGHTDSTGGDELNNELSLRRAERVKTILFAMGLKPELIRILAKGESSPIADNHTPSGQALNRRAEISAASAVGEAADGN